MKVLTVLLATLVSIAVAVAAFCAPASGAQGQPPPPPGSDVACRPSAAKPEPVVLVHGTFENRTNNWLAMAPALKQAGFCVFSLNYGADPAQAAAGVYGTARIQRSARELRAFVDRVLRRTGAERVDLVGHSQGGMMPRYYLKNLGGAADVDDLVGLSPSNYGTRNPLAPPSGDFCRSCVQQVEGSRFLRELNDGDDSPGRVSYTNIVTRYDEVVLPFENGYLDPAPQVTNVLLQDKCPTDTSEHLRTPYSLGAIAMTKRALAGPGPLDPGFQPVCAPL